MENSRIQRSYKNNRNLFDVGCAGIHSTRKINLRPESNPKRVGSEASATLPSFCRCLVMNFEVARLSNPNLIGAPLFVYLMTSTLTGLLGNRIW